jgi:hypothetical protein
LTVIPVGELKIKVNVNHFPPCLKVENLMVFQGMALLFQSKEGAACQANGLHLQLAHNMA